MTESEVIALFAKQKQVYDLPLYFYMARNDEGQLQVLKCNTLTHLAAKYQYGELTGSSCTPRFYKQGEIRK